MHILISNDDGYLAPGIVALAESMATLGNVTVIAPETNRSGASNSLTLDRPLIVQRAANGFYFSNGTPSDSVHIALTGLLSQKPDLIVSGINQGQNMGDDTLYSGTVAAATEGYLFGIPAIAFSQVQKGWAHLDSAARVAADIVKRFWYDYSKQLQQGIVEPVLLNVNIPNQAYSQIKGTQIARLGKRHPAEPVVKTMNPQGHDIFWIGPPGAASDAGEGTDFFTTANGYVSITPLQVDLTHTQKIAKMQQIFS